MGFHLTTQQLKTLTHMKILKLDKQITNLQHLRKSKVFGLTLISHQNETQYL
jgi:hypothetical protein